MEIKFEWSNDLNTGIYIIDKQHRKFLFLINRLYDAYMKEEDVKYLGFVLKELLDYVEMHFSTEERYFKIYKYPKQKIHKIAHDKLRKKVYEFYERYHKEKDSFLSLDLFKFLVTWLFDHIKVLDKEFVKFLNNNNIKI